MAEIKKGRLCWTGHLERMPNTRAAKVVYAPNPGGKRPKGIPRLRWLDDVERDLRLMGVQAWKKNQLIGPSGRKWLGRPDPLMGCSANDDDDVGPLGLVCSPAR